jgi:NAD(P)-dependent dehydrogenase (short-subunit alcohol dehydrogenase family)
VELFRSEGTLEDMTVAGWDATLSLLLRSTMLGIKHALPAMKAAGGGAIVNTSSVAGLRPGSGLTVKPPNGYPETVQKIAAACGGPG